VGEREAAAGQVAVNLRDGRRLDPMPPRQFAALAAGVVAARSRQLWS